MIMFSGRRTNNQRKISEHLHIEKIDNIGIENPNQRKNDIGAILVHGFNSTKEEITAAYRHINNIMTAEAPAVDMYGFTWASQGKLLSYFKDLWYAYKSARLLNSAIITMYSYGYKQVSIVAHSMGCYLTMQCLKKFNRQIDKVILQGGDTYRWKFKKNRYFGKIHKKMNYLVSYYSEHDRVVRYLSKLVRPFKRIGEAPLRKAPSNYTSIDANQYSNKRVRHKDYKNNIGIMQHIGSWLSAKD